MKIQVKGSEIKNHVSLFASISRMAGSMNTNKNILKMSVKDGVLTLSANTISYTLETSISCGTENGEFSVDVHMLEAIFRSSSGESMFSIEKDSEKNRINITTESSKSSITQTEVGDESSLSFGEVVSSVEVNSDDFYNGINKVKHAISKSNIKPNMASLFMKGEGEEITMYATDSFRIARNKIYRFSFVYGNEFSVLIGRDSVNMISSMIASTPPGSILIEKHNNNNGITIKSGGTMLVIPTVVSDEVKDMYLFDNVEHQTRVFIDKKQLSSFIGACNVFSDKLNTLTFSVVDSKNLSVSFSNEFGSAEQILNADFDESVIPDDFPSFNYTNIKDVIDNIEDESVVLYLNEKGGELLQHFMITGGEDKDYTEVVSPLIDRKEN